MMFFFDMALQHFLSIVSELGKMAVNITLMFIFSYLRTLFCVDICFKVVEVDQILGSGRNFSCKFLMMVIRVSALILSLKRMKKSPIS